MAAGHSSKAKEIGMINDTSSTPNPTGQALIGGLPKDQALELARQALDDLQSGKAFHWLTDPMLSWNREQALQALFYVEQSLQAIKAIAAALRVQATATLSERLKAEKEASSEPAPSARQGKKGAGAGTGAGAASPKAPKAPKAPKVSDPELRKLLGMAALFSVDGAANMTKAELKAAILKASGV